MGGESDPQRGAQGLLVPWRLREGMRKGSAHTPVLLLGTGGLRAQGRQEPLIIVQISKFG